MKTIASTVLALFALGLAAPAIAQQPAPPAATAAAPGIKRTVLQKVDVAGTNLETIVALVEIAPNFKAGRHAHPGNVVGYVMEGEFFITFDGQPEKALKAGESVLVAPGAVHDEGTKDRPTKLLATYVVEKGKPLAAPVK